ncbi:MAG TPA: UDP-N-acetylglucosamine--N-acetylmuramyl-(pentapeptide) pyrophosphoryl-undecaprenol N-acetylglucosamine transferase [Patescibacteria group bacterium]|nr:UDP-N-acetylglucosamine--N-acetylmuramyl-(pentapeptide) pyrophosphoryl-undecaprenol N-acetylglucosamine transferase [Patescibacteria group bacterium]
MQKPRNNIFLTGGHGATAALAVTMEITRRKLPVNLFWIGAKYAIEGKAVKTLEYESLPALGVKFLPIFTGRLQRKFTFWTVPSILKTPIGFIQSFWHLVSFRPKVVLSFGGYSAFPVVLAANLIGIPVVIHEQTSAAGRANLASAPLARKIALSRQESIKYFPKGKTVLTGNPVAPYAFSLKVNTSPSSLPVIFITGGSRGSRNVNRVVKQALPKLLLKYKVIHQTGELDAHDFEKTKNTLPPELSRNYEVFSRVEHEKMIKLLGESDLVVARSGANTISDILAVKRPAILIPLPISYLDEQTKNAEYARSIGVARIIPQRDLTPEVLVSGIEEAISSYEKMSKNFLRFKNPDKHAASSLVDIITPYLN